MRVRVFKVVIVSELKGVHQCAYKYGGLQIVINWQLISECVCVLAFIIIIRVGEKELDWRTGP